MQRQRHSATRSLGCHRDATGVGAGYQRCEGLLGRAFGAVFFTGSAFAQVFLARRATGLRNLPNQHWRCDPIAPFAPCPLLSRG